MEREPQEAFLTSAVQRGDCQKRVRLHLCGIPIVNPDLPTVLVNREEPVGISRRRTNKYGPRQAPHQQLDLQRRVSPLDEQQRTQRSHPTNNYLATYIQTPSCRT